MKESVSEVEELKVALEAKKEEINVLRLEDIDLSGGTMVTKESTKRIVKIRLRSVVKVIDEYQNVEVVFSVIN